MVSDGRKSNSVESLLEQKSAALLNFLKETATLRRKRIPGYGAGDKVLWFGEIPSDRPECRSTFFADNPAEFPDLWLEIRKKRLPTRQPLPEILKDWVRPQDLDQVDQDPELLPEITVLVEREVVPDAGTMLEEHNVEVEKVPEVRHLKDQPGVEDAWLEYLVNNWEPWAKEMREWQEIQRVYEDVDFMRRRLEEAEERYELIMAVGLLQWRDAVGAAAKRHLLTAPAEISLDAVRGVLTVGPAASFEKFRIELDMLELQDQPRLEGTGLDGLLDDLDVQAWDKVKVGEILRIITNRARPDAQLDEIGLKPSERTDETFRVFYAPALVLRERRPTAYEELINRFRKIPDGAGSLTATLPWQRFLREGEPSGVSPKGLVDEPYNSSVVGEENSRFYFPLPTNDEQRRIAERLKVQPCVLVKGPPGTGKSHTIANLICHLLASGDRVLVTAHAPKALTVLRDLLPADIRDLCVTAIGSTRQDQRLLEDSVRGILWRKNEWKGVENAEKNITDLERQLREFEDRCAQVELGLRECREAETYAHTLTGGYQGTAAQIAKQLEQDKQTYDWVPELLDDKIQFPLSPADLTLLAEVHGRLTEERVSEFQLETGNFPLPDSIEFTRAIEVLKAMEQAAEDATTALGQAPLESLRRLSQEVLETSKAFLIALEESAVRASRVLESLTDEILKDLVVGQNARWNRLAQDIATLLKSMEAACERVATAQINLPSDVRYLQLLADARRRLDHFQNGGRRGFGILAPRVVRETRYLEERCQVDGKRPIEPQSLETLVGYLELKDLVERFFQIWPTPSNFQHLDPRQAARNAADLAQELNQLLELFRNHGPDVLGAVPIAERVSLAESKGRTKWLAFIEAEMANRRASQARELLETWLASIRSVTGGNSHPCLQEMAQAIDERDPERWNTAWRVRERLKAEKESFRCYQELVHRVDSACSGLGELLTSSQGVPEWKTRLQQLDKAWAWSAARAWLRHVSDSSTYRNLREERDRLQDRLEKKVEEVAAHRAWQAFFKRLDSLTEQNLTAWTRAVDRIGKGTGKYAYRHRRTARQYLLSCIPKIPAWIMPLHKLWETTNAEPGLFDVVIIDEASQAGIESLVLLLLAKRIVVVGDDKQNSPEAVGVLEDDIARLARDHLQEFRFRNEFRPDTSLFDHAERSFGNLISLREHFRCVPEIIRFSNDLCYTDVPLIPLRQPPPNRVRPLQFTFVDKGSCEGDGQRINNRAEAERIVEAINACLNDEAYEGKTMGVITLQGHAQAELIEKRLAEILEPKIREERKLRCGVPATFQGDQRDVIFLSLVVAPNHRFRSLTGLADQRRFNVAMSRARDQCWLFHSVQQHDLSREDFRWRLLNFFYSPGQGVMEELYEELDRLEREAKRSPRRLGEQPDPYESWFEVDVALELLRRKYRIRPQSEIAGYRIDLMVEGLESRLAVECDGDFWHGPEAYERDMARQRQIARAGLTFVRIPESEFYADRTRSIQQVIDECDRLDIRPADELQETNSQDPILQSPPAPTKTNVPDEVGQAGQSNANSENDAFPEEDSTAGPGPLEADSEEWQFPDPRIASTHNVRAALKRIVEKEGPLTKAYLFRLYVEGSLDLRRAGRAVKREINKALWPMLRAREIIQEDELGDRSLDSLVVRLADTPKVRERPAGQRDLQEIPPSELLVVLDRICASTTAAQQNGETLARALIRHYGFTRYTDVRKKHLVRILELYRRRKDDANPSADC